MPITTSEETWRTTIETAADQDPVWTAYRETTVRDDGGLVIATTPNAEVRRSLDAVGDETVPGPVTTVYELNAAILALIDRWRDEDISAPPQQFSRPFHVEPFDTGDTISERLNVRKE